MPKACNIEKTILFLFGCIVGIVIFAMNPIRLTRREDTDLRLLAQRVSQLEVSLATASRAQRGISGNINRRNDVALMASENTSANGGGRRVFIDLGANCGNSYLRLRMKNVLQGHWEAYLWEANPQMVEWYLEKLAKKDTDVTIVPHAAWTENKEMSFFLTRGQDNVTDIKQFKAHQCNPRSHYQPAGASSLFSGKGGGDDKRRQHAWWKGAGKEIKVKAIDFAEWVNNLGLTEKDSLILKIDIEGAEIPLLKKWLKSGQLPCLVDIYYVEWHSYMIAKTAGRAETQAFENGFADAVGEVCGGRKAKIGRWH